MKYRFVFKAMDLIYRKKYAASFFLGFVLTCGFFMFQGTQNGIRTQDGSYVVGDGGGHSAEFHMSRHLLGGSMLTTGRSKLDGRWYSVRWPFELYAYSAFFDDRRSLGSLPVIRIIAVSEYLDARTIYCVYYYKNQKRGHVVQAQRADIGAGIINHGRGFREYILTCPLDGEEAPYNVSIATSLSKKPSWFMPVEIPAKPETKADFVSCISVTYWNHDPYQIVEWMEMLSELGVSKVVVYNNSLSAEASRTFQYYDKTGFVDFRQSWNFVPFEGETTIHMHMSPVINDCMYRNMHTAKNVIVTDLDELIIPKNKYTYKEMINEIDEQQERSENPVRQYMFRNAYFFYDIPHIDYSMPKHLRTLRHRWRLPASIYGYATKSIISPLACVNMHNHFCWGATKLYDTGSLTVDVQPRYALNQHYKKCHLDVWEKPGACKLQITRKSVSDNVMLRYKDRLIERVSKQLKKLNLPPL